MERVEGMTAFISGGARGIGLSIGRAFARAGMRLAIVDLDPDSLAAAKSERASGRLLRGFGRRQRCQCGNVARLGVAHTRTCQHI